MDLQNCLDSNPYTNKMISTRYTCDALQHHWNSPNRFISFVSVTLGIKKCYLLRTCTKHVTSVENTSDPKHPHNFFSYYVARKCPNSKTGQKLRKTVILTDKCRHILILIVLLLPIAFEFSNTRLKLVRAFVLVCTCSNIFHKCSSFSYIEISFRSEIRSYLGTNSYKDGKNCFRI